MIRMKHTLSAFAAALLLVFLVSCGGESRHSSGGWFSSLFSGIPDNNDVPIEELVKYILTKTDAQPCCDMEPGPVHAESGFSVILAGKQVAFYKYDATKKKMKKKLDYIKKNECVYIVGNRFPARVNGSFVMVDYEINPQKDKLIRVFDEF